MTYLKLPFQIPGYRMIRRLGSGGMATVWLAMQESLSRPVAVKVLEGERTPDEELVHRFENEARVIAQLVHPHIVGIFDVGRTSSGQIYYTMPYLPRGDLASRNLRDDPDGVLAIMRALAEALACAHDHGIVHRDVKPENVLFDSLDRPLLTDFGIALGGTRHPRMTREGATVGSSGYMSPEQARGQPLDGRSDLYSLGVVCYELLTGELPFTGADALAVALAHVEKPVPRLPMTRRLWQPLIDKALAKQPDLRFQSAEEMIAAIDVIARRLHAPARKGVSRRWVPLFQRALAIPRRARAAALCGVLLGLLALLLALMPAPERTAPAPAATSPFVDATPPAAASNPAQPPTLPDDPIAAARARHLQRASELMAMDRLASPPGDNAAEEYLAVLAAEPVQADAVHGIEVVLGLLAQRATTAIDRTDDAGAQAAIREWDTLARSARFAPGPLSDAFVATLRDAVANERATHPARARKGMLAGVEATLARIAPAPARAAPAQPPKPVAATVPASTRTPGGPAVVAARIAGGHAFAISVNEITRGEWRRFVEATGRPPSRCRSGNALLAIVRARKPDWRDPGFAQEDTHPAVCVSWDDANAYARWLSERTGAAWRLPNAAEWTTVARAAGAGTRCASANIGGRSGSEPKCADRYDHTAPVGRHAATSPGVRDISGNVSEWIDVCAKPGRGRPACGEHRHRGLSWRDDDRSSNLVRDERAGATTGYADVGFRLVRDRTDPTP